mmetsp:Transcript_15298/g.28563  ORF Transcript_15298/g.28563 Transcript_15298/m.28563 type:complete len:256 (+) Transcript_15298:276-1043(+)
MTLGPCFFSAAFFLAFLSRSAAFFTSMSLLASRANLSSSFAFSLPSFARFISSHLCRRYATASLPLSSSNRMSSFSSNRRCSSISNILRRSRSSSLANIIILSSFRNRRIASSSLFMSIRSVSSLLLSFASCSSSSRAFLFLSSSSSLFFSRSSSARLLSANTASRFLLSSSSSSSLLRLSASTSTSSSAACTTSCTATAGFFSLRYFFLRRLLNRHHFPNLNSTVAAFRLKSASLRLKSFCTELSLLTTHAVCV